MKKFGFIVFAAAILVGVVVAQIVSWGKVSGKTFSVSFDVGKKIEGSGTPASEKRDLRDFDSVDVGGVFEVEIIAGKEYSVTVEGDDNLLQFIKTEVKGSDLNISLNKRVSAKTPLKVKITAPRIVSMDVSGAASVNASGLSNSELNIEASGVSSVQLAGESENVDLNASGASKINADELKAAKADVGASGASYISVFVTKELHSDASGASSIVYSGSPENVQKDTSGGSSVTAK